MEPPPFEPPPPLTRSAPTPRVKDRAGCFTILVLAVPSVIFLLYLLVKIIGVLGADDY